MLQVLLSKGIKKSMVIDCLVAEIGSTTTVVNAFNLHHGPVEFIARGMHQTTVETDVTIGLNNAILDLKKNLGVDQLEYKEMFASSSAAGGLKITVHGLVYEMTAKAAKEAALNAGANIHLITANRIEKEHVDKIKEVNPNMIIIAGGTDFGEKDVAFQNLLDVIELNIPIIYTGNISNHERIKKLKKEHVRIVENVYPRVDDFNIIPLRKAIYETFEQNIIHAKGMQHIFDMVNQVIIPTPGAVMDATLLLNQMFDGVMTIDVGGATTDVHSVCEPKPEFSKYNDGEPRFKRTVEGDLGVFVNRMHVIKTFKQGEMERLTGMSYDHILDTLKKEPFIPQTEFGVQIIDLLTKQCVNQALDRHIGDLRRVFTTNGFKVIPDGKDTTQVKYIFLTGGALLNASYPKQIIKDYLARQQTKLAPDANAEVFLDHDYIFASLGVLSHKYPEQTKELLRQTIRFRGD
ncbi:glutamate mutase L [Peloplasma aerotolerans]|uniref:Glutamate mutase L n=1 Tax=Peloplasma aerotolerans TaxID=3044389 RepID=A0AAW6UC31_9MOLU|nr:glutamate mutase L [Mariniplasma sp. M4Ah]MDI6453708.1 glutamate mutase L [Mariniplasma sp. M4Ah]